MPHICSLFWAKANHVSFSCIVEHFLIVSVLTVPLSNIILCNLHILVFQGRGFSYADTADKSQKYIIHFLFIFNIWSSHSASSQSSIQKQYVCMHIFNCLASTHRSTCEGRHVQRSHQLLAAPSARDPGSNPGYPWRRRFAWPHGAGLPSILRYGGWIGGSAVGAHRTAPFAGLALQSP
jgi:hypothetical protein